MTRYAEPFDDLLEQSIETAIFFQFNICPYWEAHIECKAPPVPALSTVTFPISEIEVEYYNSRLWLWVQSSGPSRKN